MTHTDGRELTRYERIPTDRPGVYEVGKRIPSPKPWTVLCRSHAHKGSCATVQVEPLNGNWSCQYCAEFTWKEQERLSKALRSPDFSHTSRRGHYRDIGVVYHKDPTSPSGVRSAGSFDPFCPKAMEMVQELVGAPYDGPQRGEMAGQGGW